MSVVYLGNILGATGPSGPSGPLGCPSCFSFSIGEWSQSASVLTISALSNSNDFFISCWKVGESITINGKKSNNTPCSEHLIINSINVSLKQITTSSAVNYYDPNSSLTICRGNNIGPTGPNNGPSGPSGPTGATGPIGPGAICSGTSIDYLSLTHSSTEVGQDKVITTDPNRCWTVGQLLIISFVSSTSDYLIVKVLSYVGTSLSFKIIKRVGTLTANSWSINITGDLGVSGPMGATGPSGSVGATGPIGLPGSGSGGFLRGGTPGNSEFDLTGGTWGLECSSFDLFNLTLKQSSELYLNNPQRGQVIYIRVKTDNSSAVLTWKSPHNGAAIFWENNVPPTQTTTIGKSTLYKFVVVRYDAGEPSITTTVLGTGFGNYSV